MLYIVLLCKVLHTRLSFCWKGNMICVKSCCSPPSWQFELLVSPNSTTALRRHLLGKMAILNIWHCWRNFFATIILTPLPSTVDADGVFWHIALCFTSCFCFSHHIGVFAKRKKIKTFSESSVLYYIINKCLNLLRQIAKYVITLSKYIYQTNPPCKNTK